MKQITVTCAIALLVVVVLVTQYIEKRSDYTCQVDQLASLHRWYFDEGLATREQIREGVRQVRHVEFDGHAWLETLDRAANAILMGGDIASQVLARLDSPNEVYGDRYCSGYVSWAIWDRRPRDDDGQFNDFDIETIVDVSLALESIPENERRHFRVSASFIFNQSNWDGQASNYWSRIRHVAEAGAVEWRSGETVPAPFSDWYTDWLAKDESAQASTSDQSGS